MYNDNPALADDEDKANRVLKEMKHLKDSMVENIESLIQRDGKIEIMAEQAAQLSSVSNSYVSRAKKVKNQ